MRKKSLAVLATTLMVAGIGAMTANADEVLKIMMNSNVADTTTPGYQAVIDRFNETNELGVTIEPEFIKNADYKTKLTTLMASDSQPDIIFTWELGYLENFVNGGKIVDLQPYLDADPDWVARFNDGVLDLLTYDGDVYGIPTQQCAGVMFYNKRIFEENGVEVPTTYDEFLQVCETLKGNGVTPMALASTAADAWLVSQMIQEFSNGVGGYDVFNSLRDGSGAWNNEAMVEAGTMFKELVDAGYFEDGFTGVSGDEAREQFRMGLTAMYYNGSWELMNLADPDVSLEAENIGAFIMPAKNAENAGVALGSVDTSFAVTSNCKNVDAAVEFLKFWTEAEQAELLAYDYGRLPSTKVDLDADKLPALMNDVINLFGELKNVTPWLDRVNADFGNEFNNISVGIANGDDVQEAFDSLQSYVENR